MKALPTLSLKPDLAEAARRWDAYFNDEILDRPIVCLTVETPGANWNDCGTYRSRVLGDMNQEIDNAIRFYSSVHWMGEAIPSMMLSCATDEIAIFCGAKLEWNDASGNTNWSVPFIEDWDRQLPLKLDENNWLWKHLLKFYETAARRLDGIMLLQELDLHTNMDLLMSARGSQRLCMDLLDQPEAIDRAMQSAREVFKQAWYPIAEAGRLDQRGYARVGFGMEGAAILQCDFSCMISPDMFRRWVQPALAEEASIVKRVVYHWDGPAAQVHLDGLCDTPGIHTLAYQPGDGHGRSIDYIDLYKRVQARGRGVTAGGSPDEVKYMHRHLKPNKTVYSTYAKTVAEGEELLEWFRKNT